MLWAAENIDAALRTDAGDVHFQDLRNGAGRKRRKRNGHTRRRRRRSATQRLLPAHGIWQESDGRWMSRHRHVWEEEKRKVSLWKKGEGEDGGEEGGEEEKEEKEIEGRKKKEGRKRREDEEEKGRGGK